MLEDNIIAKVKNILELVDVKFLQNLQDFFGKTLDITLLIVHNGKWLTEPSNNTDLCRKYTRTSQVGYKRCEKCHRRIEKAAKKQGKPIISNCHIGLTVFAIPVTIENRYVGCILGGRSSEKEPEENHFRKIAKELGFDGDGYVKEMKNIKILTIEKVKLIIDLLYFIANGIAAIANTNMQLSKLGLDYKITRNFAVEEWFFTNYGDIKKPLTAREYEVLKLIVQGKNNSEIAKELFFSIHTAKAHVSAIIEKLEVEDRVQAAVKAVREGLI